jgi:hypothetical protein
MEACPNRCFLLPGKSSDGKVFVWMDRYLDTTRKGPQYLLRPEIATVAVRSIQRGVSLGQYELRAWVVMANFAHVLLLPLISSSRLLQSLKGHTAREANLVLNRNGEEVLLALAAIRVVFAPNPLVVQVTTPWPEKPRYTNTICDDSSGAARRHSIGFGKVIRNQSPRKAIGELPGM